MLLHFVTRFIRTSTVHNTTHSSFTQSLSKRKDEMPPRAYYALRYAPPSGHATIKKNINWPTHRRKTDLLLHYRCKYSKYNFEPVYQCTKVCSDLIKINENWMQARNQGSAGWRSPPRKIFASPRTMFWTYFKSIGHSVKSLAPFRKLCDPSCHKLVTGLIECKPKLVASCKRHRLFWHNQGSVQKQLWKK